MIYTKHKRNESLDSTMEAAPQEMDCSSDRPTQSRLVFSRFRRPRRVEETSNQDDENKGIVYSNNDTDRNGNLALHRALDNFSMESLMANGDVASLEEYITNLIVSRPDWVRIFNKKGLAPIHIASQNGVSLPIMHELVKAWPDSVRAETRNKQRLLPLHVICKDYAGTNDTRHQLLVFLLNAYPQAAEISTGATGELALHLCCRNYFCTLPILRVILKANPAALQTPTESRQQLPIHIACERQYMERLAVKKSSKRHTEKDKSADKSNSCNSGKIIRFLVAAFPDSLTFFDKSGELPLHTAVRGYQSATTIKYLLDVFPSSIEFVDDAGRTALHHAVKSKVACLDTIELLLKKEPSAAHVIDDYGEVPLYYAMIHHGNNLDLIYTLLRAWPESITKLCNNKNDKSNKSKRRRSGDSLTRQQSSSSLMSVRCCSV